MSNLVLDTTIGIDSKRIDIDIDAEKQIDYQNNKNLFKKIDDLKKLYGVETSKITVNDRINIFKSIFDMDDVSLIDLLPICRRNADTIFENYIRGVQLYGNANGNMKIVVGLTMDDGSYSYLIKSKDSDFFLCDQQKLNKEVDGLRRLYEDLVDFKN